MQKNEITEKEKKAAPPKIQEDINLAAPGKLRVIKRNGKVVAFENEKIQVAVTKAFLANEGGNAAASERIHEKVELGVVFCFGNIILPLSQKMVHPYFS